MIGKLFAPLAMKVAGAIITALLAFVLFLLIQIHGLPVFGGGLIAQLDRMTTLRSVEAESHRKTKANFRDAMADAHRREVFRLARVKAEQEKESINAAASYNRRLALLRDGLRARPGASVGSAAAGVAVSGLPSGSSGADAAPDDSAAELIYRCSAIALQLDELISWVERQAAIDPNEELAR